jgi:hypothetical protein
VPYTDNTETTYREISGRDGVETTLLAVEFPSGAWKYDSPNMGITSTVYGEEVIRWVSSNRREFTAADAAELAASLYGKMRYKGEPAPEAHVDMMLIELIGARDTTLDYPVVPRRG